MQRHEANIIKLLAALSAIPRWVTALVPADRTRFLWGDEVWWAVASACLSVLFALVETYAASFIMRAWRDAKAGSDAERVTRALWIIILAVLVCIMAPTIYANTMRVEFSSLPVPLIVVWSICVGASTFLVIGGVGYSEKKVPAIPVSSPVLPQGSVSFPELAASAASPLPELAEALPEEVPESDLDPKTWRQLTELERKEVGDMPVDEIVTRFNVSERTARNWRAK